MPGDLLNEFIDDARDHLQAAGQHLLALEKAPRAEEHLHGLLRRLHSVKGNAGFLNLPNLYRLLHRAEDLWHELRDDPDLECSPEVIDLELRVLDTAETMIDSLAKTGRDEARGLDRLMDELAGHDGRPGSAGLTVKKAPVTAPAKSSLPAPNQAEPMARCNRGQDFKGMLQEFGQALEAALTTPDSRSIRQMENLLEAMAADLRFQGGAHCLRALNLIRTYLAELHIYSRPMNNSTHLMLTGLTANLAAWTELEFPAEPKSGHGRVHPPEEPAS